MIFSAFAWCLENVRLASLNSAALTRFEPVWALEPPVMVPEGSYTSPSVGDELNEIKFESQKSKKMKQRREEKRREEKRREEKRREEKRREEKRREEKRRRGNLQESPI